MKRILIACAAMKRILIAPLMTVPSIPRSIREGQTAYVHWFLRLNGTVTGRCRKRRKSDNYV